MKRERNGNQVFSKSKSIDDLCFMESMQTNLFCHAIFLVLGFVNGISNENFFFDILFYLLLDILCLFYIIKCVSINLYESALDHLCLIYLLLDLYKIFKIICHMRSLSKLLYHFHFYLYFLL